MLDLLLSSARGQLRLIEGLLDIARIEAGTLALEAVPFEPAVELEGVVHLIRPEVTAKRLSLRLDIDPAARRRFVGDALAFRQVATNLVGNALKFTEHGEITVKLGAGQGGGLTLVVADTGIGIDPSEHARIFERFTQVEPVATRRVGGTGIGLAITRALVEMQNGSIRLRSALGGGATFTVELPLPTTEAMASAA